MRTLTYCTYCAFVHKYLLRQDTQNSKTSSTNCHNIVFQPVYKRYTCFCTLVHAIAIMKQVKMDKGDTYAKIYLQRLFFFLSFCNGPAQRRFPMHILYSTNCRCPSMQYSTGRKVLTIIWPSYGHGRHFVSMWPPFQKMKIPGLFKTLPYDFKEYVQFLNAFFHKLQYGPFLNPPCCCLLATQNRKE